MELKLSPQDKRLANFLAEYPMIHSAPIYFGNPDRFDSKINNGTSTLLKRKGKLYAVTNHHVMKEYLARHESEEGVTLQIGGAFVEKARDRIVFDDQDVDVCVMDFSDHRESQFGMFGNVPTKFYELGNIEPEPTRGKVVAFGGYPGVFRDRVGLKSINFHTFSSGASVVEDITDRNIVVNVDHSESLITSLSATAPPPEIGGMSGGPVFVISSERSIATFSFAGIISEGPQSLNVMLVKPIQLFSQAFG